MVDDQQAQETPVTETQESPMPSEEQKTPETPEVQQEVPQKEASVETKSEDGLPEEASERTKKEFDKLQKQLRDERTRREMLESKFQSMQPKKTELPPVYDRETGLLDERALSERDRLILEAQERATRAEAAISNYEANLESKEMFTAHPELDPNGKQFDEDFSHQVAAIKLHSMVEPSLYGNKQLSGKEAADFLKTKSSKSLEAVKQQASKDAIEQLTPKEQAALEATGSSGRRTQVSNLDDLRLRSRKGDSDAIIERLKNL